KNGKEWLAFPAKSYETKAGATAWQPLVEFAESATEARRQFQEQAVAAIHDFIEEQNAEVTYERRPEPTAGVNPSAAARSHLRARVTRCSRCIGRSSTTVRSRVLAAGCAAKTPRSIQSLATRRTAICPPQPTPASSNCCLACASPRPISASR